MYVHIDIETRSRVDLKAEGVYKYAFDPSTEVLCISWAIEDHAPVMSWHHLMPEFPLELVKLFADDSVIFKAHNAAFERLLFWHVLCPDYNLPEPALDRFYCTATQARANALPGHLGDCARCLNVTEQKSDRGKELIKLLSVPRPDGSFLHDPALLEEFSEYCAQDVRTERDISRNMRELTPAEREDYIISEQINDRGIMVDVEFATAMLAYSEQEQESINREIEKLTYGQIAKARSPRLTEYVFDMLPVELHGYMQTKRTKSGLSLDADVMDRMLGDQNLPPDVRELVELKALASSSSVAKYKGMRDRSCEDGRVRGAFVLYGAGQTHRYSSRGLQLHNMPRLTAEQPAELREELLNGGVPKEDLMYSLKSMLRPSIMAKPGHVFVCNDWSGIEARVLPWASGDPRCEKLLDVFRRGEDIYLVTAAMMREDRLVGKVATLAMGYEGGVGAFQSMARNYHLLIPDDKAELYKRKWRKANPWAQDFWLALVKAVKEAIREPGNMVPVGRVYYLYTHGTLYCVLPSGTILSYPDAKLELRDGPYGASMVPTCIKASIKPKAGQKKWPRMDLYGGLLAENLTQAIAGDTLREGLKRVSQWSDEVVLHVHDEIVLEVPEAEADMAMEDLDAEMRVVPDWAEGLPLDCEGWIGKYYRK